MTNGNFIKTQKTNGVGDGQHLMAVLSVHHRKATQIRLIAKLTPDVTVGQVNALICQ